MRLLAGLKKTSLKVGLCRRIGQKFFIRTGGTPTLALT